MYPRRTLFFWVYDLKTLEVFLIVRIQFNFKYAQFQIQNSISNLFIRSFLVNLQINIILTTVTNCICIINTHYCLKKDCFCGKSKNMYIYFFFKPLKHIPFVECASTGILVFSVPVGQPDSRMWLVIRCYQPARQSFISWGPD